MLFSAIIEQVTECDCAYTRGNCFNLQHRSQETVPTCSPDTDSRNEYLLQCAKQFKHIRFIPHAGCGAYFPVIYQLAI
jgi:hypothetical protein